jgi:predicted nucleic-acid-binding protein
MRAVDTNVLIRLVTRDDPKQVAAAEAFVATGAWASHLVLVETLWVLESVYDLDAKRCATAIDMLLNHTSRFKIPTLLRRRSRTFDASHLSDYLIASSSRSHAKPATCRLEPSIAISPHSMAPSVCSYGQRRTKAWCRRAGRAAHARREPS